MTRRTLCWTAVALLGIALSATVAWSASLLAGQRIGLSSEPLAVATSNLAPPAPVLAKTGKSTRAKRPATHPLRHRPTPTTSTHTRAAPSAGPVTIPAPLSRVSPPPTSGSARGSGSASSGFGAAATTTAATTATSSGHPAQSASSRSGDDAGGAPVNSSGGSRNQRDD